MDKIGHRFVKTHDFEKSIVIIMSLMNDLWKMIKNNQSFCMVLKYNAETVNVNVDYFTGASDESPVEN